MERLTSRRPVTILRRLTRAPVNANYGWGFLNWGRHRCLCNQPDRVAGDRFA